MNNSLFALIGLSFFLGCGCWLFFLWGVQKGEFSDLERPKHRMLDDDEFPIPSRVEATPDPPVTASDPPVTASDGHELTLSHRHAESPQAARMMPH